MMPRSLKAKLLLGVSVSMVILIAAGGVVDYLLFRSYLYGEMDHALFDKLRFLRASCAQAGTRWCSTWRNRSGRGCRMRMTRSIFRCGVLGADSWAGSACQRGEREIIGAVLIIA